MESSVSKVLQPPKQSKAVAVTMSLLPFLQFLKASQAAQTMPWVYHTVEHLALVAQFPLSNGFAVSGRRKGKEGGKPTNHASEDSSGC